MGKSGNDATIGANCKKYGVPFYGASFVPRNAIKSSDTEPQGEDEVVGGGSHHVIFAGGGGEGRSGIPNALIISHFDPASNYLSDQPVNKLETGDDLPYRMAVHPGGEGVICSLPKSCRWFEWEATKKEDVSTLGLKQSEKVLYQLELIEQQLAVTFSRDGSLLAVGGEDGKLRAFKWPSMESLLDVPGAHASVKNLDFSPDGKFLVSVGSGGPGRVWDILTSTNKASLAKEKDEVFGFCRFSQNSMNDQVLYVTAMRDRGGSIVKWNTTTWKRMSSKYIVRDPISAFNISDDGKFLAIGTIQGDIYILNASNIKVHTVVKKAHLGLVTALAFSHDSRALASASLDSSARVTQIKEIKKNGFNIWIILLMILVAATLYYAKTEGYFV
ncbi:SEC12-like protein 2 [Cynara cardunculus var. scolymus]|uniref:SEC12-like protein 2 n=1 Tax=Cynara cardunculus var. scolymus TaxID=59895 RepID=UPI000D629AA0|nr:SEC12-like protein 2 [Cynara cardunculus var. scolymus]XP_024973348.1 SEC12-like protein 2 [Cynara cardunculus var. scolymus]XP_024973349.1 SEC12-like protein 2 [Cynara cardunculus var. scolymus]